MSDSSTDDIVNLVDITIEDFHPFVQCMNLLKTLNDKSLGETTPISLNSKGIVIVLQNTKLRTKMCDMYVKLTYQKHKLINYYYNEDFEEEVVLNINTKLFEDRTKAIKVADTFSMKTDTSMKKIKYFINNYTTSEIPIIDVDEPLNLDHIKNFNFDEFNPKAVINKNTYTQLSNDIKRIKKNVTLDAKIYRGGIKFTFGNYGEINPINFPIGKFNDDETPLYDMKLDSQFISFVSPKLSKLFPDNAPIQIYSEIINNLKYMIIRFSVGSTGIMDIIFNNN